MMIITAISKLGGDDDNDDNESVDHNANDNNEITDDDTFSLQYPHCDRDPEPSHHLCLLGHAGL